MKFRKKPVVIEAFQWEPEARAGLAPNWFYEGCAKRALCPEFNGTLTVHTLEGTMRADPGDWIIKGVAGEFYPCKPDIFAATYEPVSDDAPAAPQAEPKREPLSEYARAVERAAYERAAKECELQITGSDYHFFATHGHWDHMAQAATNCAAAIRVLGRQHD